MRYLKKFEIFEKKSNTPQIGDYVVLLDMYNPPLDKDIIGRIIDIEDVEQTETYKKVKSGDFIKFYEVEELDKSNTHYYLELEEIDFFSPNIDDAKALINSNKYNL